RNVVAAVIASRDAYDAIEGDIRDGDLGEQGNIIFGAIRDYYGRDRDAQSCDSDLLTSSIVRGLSNPKHQEMFTDLVGSISNVEVSPENVVHDFIEVRRQAAGAKLASALAAGKSAAECCALVDNYSHWANAKSLDSEKEIEVVRGTSVVDLVEGKYAAEELIKIWPRSLNERLDGGLLRGHHMLVFARPEMGKTLILINMIAGFLAQKLTVLYVGNEDPISDIVMRVVSRLTGMTKYEIMEDADTADYVAREKGYDNLILAGLAPGTPREIQSLIDTYAPDVVMIDQLRNINVNEEHFVQKLEKAATIARNIGKSNNVLMVSVTQAGDSASGKGPLEMGDVDSSNTGIPAQVDVMVGIGATPEDEAAGRRIISLCKNKRSGRHDFFPVGIDTQLSKVRSLT
ncbi:MAG: DnaB-like helicase C-terminal domain-containing protein, partial [Nitrosopumilus sp.]